MLTPIRLISSNLRLIKPPTTIPTYDRNNLSPGILHFGVGNFHRAHQAVYLHQLFQIGSSRQWGIIGASILPSDPVYQALRNQHYLYTTIAQFPTKTQSTIIASILGHLPPQNPTATFKALTDPRTRIVSLTITEGGYYQAADTEAFDLTHPDIVNDITTRTQTVFGLITSALQHRRNAGIPPFTVMSCDNVPHNGHVTKAAVSGFASLIDPTLAAWIDANVSFPCSMVDRITPATGSLERARIRNEFGIQDDAPVFCEGFTQWVLEDNFSAGRPELELVGVQFVEDVATYETMKIRILNGGHATIAYPAGLLDIMYAYEAMEQPLIKKFLVKVEKEHILPLMPVIPGTDATDYFNQIVQRFANRNIKDTVQRLCLGGSMRQPKFIVPSIRDGLQRGRDVKGLALVSAFWCRYCTGVTESGKTIEKNDPKWDELKRIAVKAKENPIVWLQQDKVYGDIGQDDRFVQSFSKWLNMIWKDGTLATMETYLNGRDVNE